MPTAAAITKQRECSDPMYYIIAHMSKTKPSLKVGDDVFPGKVVGYVGNTGKQYTSWYRTAENEHPDACDSEPAEHRGLEARAGGIAEERT